MSFVSRDLSKQPKNKISFHRHFKGRFKSAVVDQASEKTEENKHGAVIVGCSAESETLLGLKIEA